MTLLSKTAILCANDLQTEDVEVPEWGGSVRVRSFTGRERDAFEASMVRGEGKARKVDLTNMRARLVGLTVIDEGGQRLFTDDEVKAALEELPEASRMPVLLADVEGFAYKEIAEMLDVPIGTVMSRLHRGRKAMHKRLYEFAQARGLVQPLP